MAKYGTKDLSYIATISLLIFLLRKDPSNLKSIRYFHGFKVCQQKSDFSVSSSVFQQIFQARIILAMQSTFILALYSYCMSSNDNCCVLTYKQTGYKVFLEKHALLIESHEVWKRNTIVQWYRHYDSISTHTHALLLAFPLWCPDFPKHLSEGEWELERERERERWGSS